MKLTYVRRNKIYNVNSSIVAVGNKVEDMTIKLFYFWRVIKVKPKQI